MIYFHFTWTKLKIRNVGLHLTLREVAEFLTQTLTLNFTIKMFLSLSISSLVLEMPIRGCWNETLVVFCGYLYCDYEIKITNVLICSIKLAYWSSIFLVTINSFSWVLNIILYNLLTNIFSRPWFTPQCYSDKLTCMRS